MQSEAMVVVVVQFPVILVSKARKISVWMGAKVDLRRMRDASWRRAKPLRAYSIVAHGLSCVRPQALTSVPLFPTILLFAMRGSQLLTVSLDAVLLRKILFAGVVEPH
ncbi:uncharacterized protein MONOS_1614 [Monocercomonoides exilis]|uniref:uncharacterized protein n=1 Tax=Monocercomonoides exilis TaxID=2049356 RepID=UPI00355A89F5|nr:hypothetical protein MONOS_1614 [Monocercomonoides exilis]|eukprot:MONOS_1614.1-p1 / transcript=MONOS_1614.1 / gene=MONOS_1614 / organism=Monocercomonoides_exilis_PA203 / gene_product=unspecified product / transcript_product=unspecified product / location=Mono_scaffold00029:122195-122518(-) / protein_length=108 / sequence_SO=supercontig / SO=protein_coding / is_pseudo=false